MGTYRLGPRQKWGPPGAGKEPPGQRGAGLIQPLTAGGRQAGDAGSPSLALPLVRGGNGLQQPGEDDGGSWLRGPHTPAAAEPRRPSWRLCWTWHLPASVRGFCRTFLLLKKIPDFNRAISSLFWLPRGQVLACWAGGPVWLPCVGACGNVGTADIGDVASPQEEGWAEHVTVRQAQGGWAVA